MSKKISLDDVLKNLQAQASADWSMLESTESIIGGAVAPAQAECHTAPATDRGTAVG
jgi:hypothetical protein